MRSSVDSSPLLVVLVVLGDWLRVGADGGTSEPIDRGDDSHVDDVWVSYNFP